jgi:hypothetical protein
MSDSLKESIKVRVDNLKNLLETIVYEGYLNELTFNITLDKVKSIDNDLGFISVDVSDQDDLYKLNQYDEIINEYSYLLNNIIKSF